VKALVEEFFRRPSKNEHTHYYVSESPAEQHGPVQSEQSPQHPDDRSEGHAECAVFFVGLSDDSAAEERTQEGTRPRRKRTGRGVWTSESFLLAANYPLKRYWAQSTITEATPLLVDGPTANPASGWAQTKTHDESAEQLEASTAAVGVADSDSLKKGRQNKRAEKAASKERALLQSAETGVLETTNAFESTNAVETTIDHELLRELKQINIILA